MKHILTVLFSLLVVLLWAQEDPQFDRILQDYFQPEGPGATAVVVKGGDIVYAGAIGKADVELNVAMAVDHVFRLGSITKQFTAIAIMMLQEEGALAVTDPITNYLTEYPTHGHEITVEHLLTHTSGIQSYTSIPGFMQNETRKDLKLDELIEVFQDMDMNFSPGEEWRYNNSGYILLGAIIEEVSGKSYAEFIQEKIFDPLQMKNSYYGSHSRIIPMRASGYQPQDGGIANARYLSMTLPHAAGSLLSTVEDLAKWNTAVFDHRLVSEHSLKEVFTPYITSDGENTRYGYGWQIHQLLGSKIYRHGGGIFGFLTTGLYAPEEDVYVAVLSNCNCNSPEDAGTRMMALAIGKSLEAEEISMSPEQLREYIGVYAIEDSEEKRVLRLEGGKLFSQRGDNQEFRIFPVEKDVFAFDQLLIRMKIKRDENAEIVGHYMLTPEGEKTYAALTKEEVKVQEEVHVPEQTLDRYVGRYALTPDFIITVSRQEDRLMAQATGQGAFVLTPRDQVTFVVPQVGARVVFTVQDSGVCDELVLHQGGQVMPAKRIKD